MERTQLRGRIVPGLREAAGFTQLEWVRRQLIERFDLDPHPGTLNLRVEDDESLTIWRAAVARATITIDPPDPGFCQAIGISGMLAGRIPVVALVPHVEGYPPDKVELLAACHVKQTLGVDDDTILEVELRPR